MATLNFYLDKADKQGKSFIMMTYLAGGQKFRHSVKLKINPGKWSSSRQRLKENSRDDQFTNAHLDNLEKIIKEVQSDCLLRYHSIDFGYVKQNFYDTLGKKAIKRTFPECFEEYIACLRITKKYKTIERYISALKQLKKFRKVKHFELTFERINICFYESFTNYLFIDKKQLNNSVTSYIKTIRAFINFCAERGYCKPNKELKNFKVFQEDSALIYLTEEELIKIFQLKLENPEIIVVHENFCFALF